MPRPRLALFAIYGAVLDLLLFAASFIFFGGPHGPAGPIFVLWFVNAPIADLGSRLFPFEDTPLALGPVLAVVEVAVNGALYGLIVALFVALWRAIVRRHPRA